MPSRYMNRHTMEPVQPDPAHKYKPSRWVMYANSNRPIAGSTLDWLRHHKNMIRQAIDMGHVKTQYLPRAKATILHFQARIDAAKAYK